jgi:mannose-6-phosphate isomerase-like protein (cupin superfamily)
MTPDNATGLFTPERVEKPWGHEVIWAAAPGYVGKVLVVAAGHALSLQYHERKDETLHLLRGRVRLWVGASPDEMREQPFAEGEGYRLLPGTLHRLEAVTDVEILEASTPELEDVVRVRDRYGRV